MNIHQHPELIERLAAEHALGTLRHGARRRFEALARQHPAVQAALDTWAQRLAAITELQAPVQPSAHVWTRIDNLVAADAQLRGMARARETGLAAPPPVPWWGRPQPLRWLAGLATVATVVVGVVSVQQQSRQGATIAALETALASKPAVQYVAVLVPVGDAGGNPGLLVTFDGERRQLKLQRVSDYRESADRSLQLWALPPGAKPRSLGVLGADALVRLQASESDLSEVPALAVSVEPLGGVPSDGGPTGPVVFSGRLLQNRT
jgi:anti-sigma-K factor RskA